MTCGTIIGIVALNVVIAQANFDLDYNIFNIEDAVLSLA